MLQIKRPTTFTEFLELTTPYLREKASSKAIKNGLKRSGTTQNILYHCDVLKNNSKVKTIQDDYIQKLESFYIYSTTHFHYISKNSMLDDFLDGKRIYWNSYK